MDLPVDAGTVSSEAQKSRAMMKRLDVQVVAFADQFEIDFVGLIQRFPGAEFEYLKVTGKTLNVEGENDGFNGAEHPHFLVSISRLGTLRGSAH